MLSYLDLTMMVPSEMVSCISKRVQAQNSEHTLWPWVCIRTAGRVWTCICPGDVEGIGEVHTVLGCSEVGDWDVKGSAVGGWEWEDCGALEGVVVDVLPAIASPRFFAPLLSVWGTALMWAEFLLVLGCAEDKDSFARWAALWRQVLATIGMIKCTTREGMPGLYCTCLNSSP